MTASSNAAAKPMPYRAIAWWIAKGVLAAAFIAAGAAKLAGVPMMVAEFDQIGLGQWFRYATGIIEIAGALLLLWPASVAFGAAILGAVCIGAFFAQALIIHQDVVHTIVPALVFAAIAWTHRGQVAALLR